jgi:benzoate-CoA ligase
MSESSLVLPERFNASTYFVDRHLVEGRGDNLAIYYLDQKITYGEVAENVNKTGNFLLNLGVEMEDRVLLLLLDCPEFVYSFFAAIKIGAVPIPTNTMLKPEDYEYLLNDSRAKVIVVSEELVENINQIAKKLSFIRHIVVVGKPGPGQLGFHELLQYASLVLDTAPTCKDDSSFWLYSSGTTGFPKGAVHLQHDMVYCAVNYAKEVLEISEDDLTYSVAKLFFAYGLGNSLFFPFSVGATTVLSPQRPTPEHVFEVINRYQPTLFFSVPTSYNALLQVPGAEKNYDLSSIRLCVSAGEALPEVVYWRWMENFELEILDGIGSTELLHIFISNRARKVKPGSSGYLVPGYEGKILNEDGDEVPQGEQGTLLIKGDSAAAYYWNKHDKSKQTFQGEWLNTGDRYFQDRDGCFWYMGRSDDMIKSGGIWVSPVEVENTLLGHPAVLECAVTGWAESNGLVKPKAFVVLKQDYQGTQALIEELQVFVKGKIAQYKYPRWIDFVSNLPKTATGKIQRYKLRQTL